MTSPALVASRYQRAAGPGRRRVIDDGQGCGLIIAPDVLGHPSRNTGDSGLFPRRALSDPNECLKRLRNSVGTERTRGGAPLAVLGHRPVIGGPQTARLIHRRVGLSVIAGRQRAHQNLRALVGHPLGKIFQGRSAALQQREAMRQHPVLEGCIAGLAERTAEREVAEQTARRGRVDQLLTD